MRGIQEALYYLCNYSINLKLLLNKKFIKNKESLPQLVWASGLSTSLRTQSLPVQFLVRAHAWVEGQVPFMGACKKQLIDVSLMHQCLSPSLSLSLPQSLKINKIIKKIKQVGYAYRREVLDAGGTPHGELLWRQEIGDSPSPSESHGPGFFSTSLRVSCFGFALFRF